MRSATIRAIALLAVSALTACSGSGTPSNPIPARAPIATSSAPASTSSKTRATFVVHWPSGAQAAAARKRRQTLSPSTQSITVSVNGGSGTVVNKPTLTGSPSTTSVSIIAPPGNDEFTFTAWDQLGGVGNILDQVSTSQNILADANNTVSATLDGICAALVPTLSGTPSYIEEQTTSVPLVSGSRTVLKSARLVGPSAKTFNFTRVDADGNTILTSAGVSPLSVSESGTTSHVTIAVYGTSGTAFTLTPLAAEPDGFSTTITATAPDCGTGTPTFPNSFQLSTSAEVLVADTSAGILAYDQDGTEVAQITSSPANTNGVIGLAYNSKSNYLVSVEQNTSGSGGSIAFQTRTVAGSVIGASTFTPMNVPGDDASTEPPGNLVYDAANGNFYLALRASSDSGAVEEYTISASTASYVGGTTLDDATSQGNYPDPYCFAVFPTGDLVIDDLQATVTDLYTESLLEYYSNGDDPAVQNLQTTSLSSDSTRGNVVDFNLTNNYGSVLNETTVGLSGFSSKPFYKSLNSVATFDYPPPASNGAYYVSVYSPGNDEFYMFSGFSAAGLSGSTLYQGGSTTSNLPPGAFPGLSEPNQAVVLP